MTDWFTGEQRLGTGQFKKGNTFRERFERELNFMEQWKFCVKQTDTVYMLGNMVRTPRGRFDITWYNWLSSLPGYKVLLLGCNDNTLFNQDGSFTKWYESFGFEKVIPFNQFFKYKHVWTKGGQDLKERSNNIMLTCLPASGFLNNKEDHKFLRLHKKFRILFQQERHNFALNIHSHTKGSCAPHKTFDISLYPNLLTIDQLIDRYMEMKR